MLRAKIENEHGSEECLARASAARARSNDQAQSSLAKHPMSDPEPARPASFFEKMKLQQSVVRAAEQGVP